MDTDALSARFNEIAATYDAQRRFFIPCFDDYYETSTSFLATIRNDIKSVLDLGAGTGLLSMYLYKNFPGARFTLVDVSDRMLEVGRRRFSGMANVDYIVSDYSKGLPDSTYDLIASALSIHHLDNAAKMNCYSAIYSALNDNGIFLNCDQFNAASESMNAHYNAWWYDSIRQSGISEEERNAWLTRRELDRENTITETIGYLGEAGFSTAECIYSYMKFGVIVAMK